MVARDGRARRQCGFGGLWREGCVRRTSTSSSLLLSYLSLLLFFQCSPPPVAAAARTTDFLNTTHHHLPQQDCTVETPTVVVVGAGLSGLAAAWELEARGCRCLLLLEARDRIGGRLQTASAGNGGTAELGGTYIHGGESPHNSFQWLVQETLQLPTLPSGGTSTHPGQARAQWRYRQQVLPKQAVEDKSTRLLHEWMEGMQKRISQHNETLISAHQCSVNKNSSIPPLSAAATGASEMLLQLFSEQVMSDLSERNVLQSSLDRALLDFELQISFEYDRGASYYEHSLDGFANDWDWVSHEGPDHIVLQGMDSVLQALQSNLHSPILLHHVVTEIHYSHDACRVVTSQGAEFASRACIVTLPIGVLQQQHADLFDPPLPRDKQDALERAGVASFNTLIVQWDRPVCQDANYTAYYLLESSLQRSDKNPLRAGGLVCPERLRRNDDEDSRGENVVPSFLTQFYIHGTSYDFDNDTFWKEQAVQIMKEVFPEQSWTTDSIVDVQVSKWHEDSYSLGSYSATTTLTRTADRSILRRPLGQSVFFAGEHTHDHGRYQSMDGAYETGICAAANLVAALRRTSNQHSNLKQEYQRRNPHQLWDCELQ